jgi:putative resolvase
MENTITITQAAQMLGVTVKTMQRWEREGRLVPIARSETNRRRYTTDQIQEFLGMRKYGVVDSSKRMVAYCRISSQAQKPDLKNQRRILEEFCIAKGLANVEFIEEVGGGLNFERKKFTALMDAVGRGEVGMLIIAHKDRLTRFGFEWFAHYAKINGCELLVLNQERWSPEQEMVQDLMTIVHCFSSRLYGLRNYRKKLNEALKGDANHESGTQGPTESDT